MRRIILWAVIGFVIVAALSLMLNPIFWGGEDYADSFAWGIVGAIVGFLWAWREPTPICPKGTRPPGAGGGTCMKHP